MQLQLVTTRPSNVCGCEIDWSSARRAVTELLKVYRVDILKVLDPLVDSDFLAITQQIADELYAISGPLEVAHVEAALAALDVDWAALTEAQHTQVVRAANLAMRDLPAKVVPKIESKLKIRMKEVARNTKVSATKTLRLNVKTSLDLLDTQMIDSISSIGSWVTEEYAGRIAMFEAGIDTAVGEGLRAGLRSGDIADNLRKLGNKIAIDAPKNYWRLVALNLSNRARNYSHLKTMKQGGISNYIFSAVMDKRTTLICRELDGRTFPVSNAMSRFADLQIQSAGDYQAAEKVMPFVKERAIGGGVTELYVDPPGMGVTVLAEAVGSAVGQADVRGEFRNVLSTSELAAAGVMVPPVHQACRSTIIADV